MEIKIMLPGDLLQLAFPAQALNAADPAASPCSLQSFAPHRA
jgi:hypothetical protein